MSTTDPAMSQSPAPAPAKPSSSLPSIGRIVIYTQAVDGDGNPVAQFPAIVIGVNPPTADDDPGSVDLFVFGKAGQVLVQASKQGSGVGQWSWPVIPDQTQKPR